MLEYNSSGNMMEVMKTSGHLALLLAAKVKIKMTWICQLPPTSYCVQNKLGNLKSKNFKNLNSQ